MQDVKTGFYKYKGWTMHFILSRGYWKAEKEHNVQYGGTLKEVKTIIEMIEGGR